MDSAAGVVEWSVFAVVVGLVLAIDLVASRGKEQPSMRAAMAWSGVWIGLGLVFGGWIAWRLGSAAGVSYLTAYLLEKSLSVDNLFLFLLIFEQTGIPALMGRVRRARDARATDWRRTAASRALSLGHVHLRGAARVLGAAHALRQE